MNYIELSDLEEGEILEYDTNIPSSNYKSENIGIVNNSFELLFKQQNEHLKFVKNRDLSFPKQGYINKKLKEKLKLNDAIVAEKTKISLADLESISSEGEYKSDEYDRCSSTEKDYYNNAEKRKREKRSSKFYGAVEDIMSEIGETICRKSRCNYKKRKSKEVIANLDKCSDSTYDLWRRKVFSSHLKSRKERRKVSFCDSDSDLGKDRVKKNKRKRRDYEDEEKVSKKLDLRDFDEVRRSLLEKLKKEKAKEESKTPSVEPILELEASEIQEVDMLIDCTNYVDNPLHEETENAAAEEKEGEDELDLIQLRLIALASNKKRKDERDSVKTEESPPVVVTEKKPDVCREETDLDRTELLLRAEALKTALIKKHQRRLNKLKVEKPSEFTNTSITKVVDDFSSPGAQSKDLVEEVHVQEGCGEQETESCKKNSVKSNEGGAGDGSDVPSSVSSAQDIEIINVQGTPVTSNGNSKKTQPKTKTKRKKRKPVPSANLKENNQIKESLEEDDRTLRTQLLSDLMKKKSLKDLEKKSILVDSVQAAENKPPPPVTEVQPPKETSKPLPPIKKTLLKKVNVAKSLKANPPAKFPKPEIQRIIVHLGSEDSSDEDAGPPSTPQIFPEQIKVGSETNPIVNLPDAKLQSNEVIRANYEKSVELLLSQTRKKVEGEKRSAAATTLATPEAVYKHLPPSQRLEYIRLKQKIAERESQRKGQRKEAALPKPKVGNFPEPVAKPPESSDSEPAVRNSSSASKTAAGVPAAPVEATTKEKGNCKPKNNFPKTAVKSSNKYVAPPANGAKPAASVARSLLLLPSSQALMSKLKLLLKKIKIEKMMEENYEKEISKLKNQLSLFEKRKCEQRFKIKKLWAESMKTYKAIQGITNKSNEKAAPKEKEKEKESVPGDQGTKEKSEKSEEEKNQEKQKVQEVDEEGKDQEKQKVQEVDEEGKNQEKQKVQEVDEEGNDKKSSEPEMEITHNEGGDNNKTKERTRRETSGVGLAEYDSPLRVFSKASEPTNRVDPNVEVCQFDLMGVCKDEECAYQHLRIAAK